MNKLSILAAAVAAVALAGESRGDGGNMLVNPNFEEASTSDYSGKWGYIHDGNSSLGSGWTYGEQGDAFVGVAYDGGNKIWLPKYSSGHWTLLLQCEPNAIAYVEQTVNIAETGSYEFSFSYATRDRNNWRYGGRVILSVIEGGRTNDFPFFTYKANDANWYRAAQTMRLEGGRSYTFRITNNGYNLMNTTVNIDGCSLVAVADSDNLLANPEFEEASTSDYDGKWGYMPDGNSSFGRAWTWGRGSAGSSPGVAKDGGNNLWLPKYTSGHWTAFIQCDPDTVGYIEQTLPIFASGMYAFSFAYSSRDRNKWRNGGRVILSVCDGVTTNEYPYVEHHSDDTAWHRATQAMYLEGGKSYTFRLTSPGAYTANTTVNIDGCSLLPAADDANLLANPDFELAVTGDNKGNCGYIHDGKTYFGGAWTYGEIVGRDVGVGVTKKGDMIWPPAYVTGSWSALLQCAPGSVAYLEQTLPISKSGMYEFSFAYATRNQTNWMYPGWLALHVVDGTVTNVYQQLQFKANDPDWYRAAYRLDLEAGHTYSFRIVNLGICDNNATANIDDCALRSLPTGRILTEPVVLDEDTDWSDEQIYLAASASIDLAGHALTLGGFHCEADQNLAITDTSSGQPGELRLAPAANETATFYRSVGGNLKVVKAGDGTLLWRGGYIDAAVPVIVTNGVFREEVYHKDAFGTSGTITVADRGQFDLNWAIQRGYAPVQKRTFYIEGEGPDGTGALVNNAASSIFGYHCSRVILTGDATLGGTARIDFRGTCSLEGAGYDLTIKNTGMVAFCSGKADLSAKNVIVRDGGIFQPCSDGTGTFAIEGSVQLVNGGEYRPWSEKNVTMTLDAPVVVGEGGGEMASDAYWYSQKGQLLVQSDSALNLGNEGGWFASVSNAAGGTIRMESSASAWMRNDGTFFNGGDISATVGELAFGPGSVTGTDKSCRLVNDGTITTGGSNKFYLNAGSTLEGVGTIVINGAAASLYGDCSAYGGTIRYDAGVLNADVGACAGRLVLNFAGKDLPVAFDASGLTATSGSGIVLVDVGERELEYDTRLISWTTPPAAGVRFALSQEKRGRLVKDANGVSYARCPGLMLIFR